MAPRRQIHVPGLDHKGQPIPVAVAGGGWIFSSPIGPRPFGGGDIPDSLGEQIFLTFGNLARVLDAAGVDRAHVMFVRVLLTDLGHRAAFNEAWTAFFGMDGPARQVTENSLPESAKVVLRFTALDSSAGGA
jgi:enamine deaminase RidA (YjgF/YER057c/UK114 family)